MADGALTRRAILASVLAVAAAGCSSQPDMIPDDLPADATNILYLHHSTGETVWDGGVQLWFDEHNMANDTSYNVVRREFPHAPYPAEQNDPYDYWRLWVEHSGDTPYLEQATLESLTAAYDVIVWKNCFLAADIEADIGSPDVSSDRKSLENYTLQYDALRAAMLQFPNTMFVVWTLPPKVQGGTNAPMAERAQEFANWVQQEWDRPGDNIHLWDFRSIAAPDGTYLLDEYATGLQDSHPNDRLAAMAAPAFVQRVVDVVEGRGDSSPQTGHGGQE